MLRESHVTKAFAVLVTAGIVVVLGGAAYFFLPTLQSSRRIVDERADEGAERARRLLDKYEPDADYYATMVEKAGVNATESGQSLDDWFARQRPTSEDSLQAEADRLNDMLEGSRRRLNHARQELARLAPGGQEVPQSPIRFGGNVAQQAGWMQKGLAAREPFAKENVQYLKQSLSAANQATSITDGGASASDNLQANRMKAVALDQQAGAEARQAERLADEASQHLNDLAATANLIARVKGSEKLVAGSGVEDRISATQQRIDELTRHRDELDGQITDLEGKIAQTRDEIQKQLAAASDAQAQMDDLERHGLDYEHADAVERFRQEYDQYAKTLREASRRAADLQHGMLSNAKIDPAGGYLDGKFISEPASAEIEYTAGLDEFEGQLASLKMQRDGAGQILESTQAELDRLNRLVGSLQAEESKAAQRLQDLRETARTQLEAYIAKRSEVTAAEDKAINTYKQSARAYKTAERSARARTQNVPPGAVQPGKPSPYELVEQDQWLAARVLCQAAQANLEASMVLYNRYSGLKAASSLLSSVQNDVTLSDISLDDIARQIAEAQTQGKELVNDAADALEKSARDLRNHWTVAATLAAADYMLALYGEPQMVEVAMANYRAVVQGRENDPYVQPFAQRLEELRNR